MDRRCWYSDEIWAVGSACAGSNDHDLKLWTVVRQSPNFIKILCFKGICAYLKEKRVLVFCMQHSRPPQPQGNRGSTRATCNSDVKGRPDERIVHVYGPLRSEKDNDGWDLAILHHFAAYNPNIHNNRETVVAIVWKGPVQGFHRNDNHSIAGSCSKPSLEESRNHDANQKKDSTERQRPANKARKGKEKGHYTPQPKSSEIMEH